MHTLFIINSYSIEGVYNTERIKAFKCSLSRDELVKWILEQKSEFVIKKNEYDRLSQLWSDEKNSLSNTPEYISLVEEQRFFQKRLNNRYNNVPKKDRDESWKYETDTLDERLEDIKNKFEKYFPSWNYPSSPPTRYYIDDLTVDFSIYWDNTGWNILTMDEFLKKYTTQNISITFPRA